MRVTRRWMAHAGTATAFAILAVLLERPLFLGVTILLAAYLLTVQYAFSSDLTTITETTVTHAFTPETAIEHAPIEHTATLSLPTPVESTITVTLSPPTIWQTSPPTGRLQDSLTLTTHDTISVAGQYTAPAPEATVTDPHGLYTETLELGSPATVTVDPSTPRDIAVYSGGDRVAAGYGEHGAQRGSAGLDPGELRKYLPGDPTNRIDWNATARLGEPHVREFDAETDRDTILILDHRSALTDGPPGRTQLDYLREIALWFVGRANDLADPLALYTVGDDGLTTRTQLQTGRNHYRRLEHHLYDLTPTTGTTHQGHRRTSTDLTTAASRLTGDGAFERTLQPYVEHAESSIERVETDPLFHAVTTALDQTTGTPWIVLLTDDTNQAELYETIRATTRRDTTITTFITPNALFAPSTLTTADTAYADYLDFLDFRDRLTDRTSRAYEVGPGDRLETILSKT